MRYFHRASLAIEDVLSEADHYFGARLEPVSSGRKTRTFTGPMGTVSLSVRAEGGHYTLVTVSTDQVGESEIDKLSKRFLTLVHKRDDPDHVVRGAY